MKSFLFALLVLFIFSCSSDDNNTPDSTPIVIEGLYTITAVNTDPATDLNFDGNTSTNQMDETDCYNNMAIAANGFGDFNGILKRIALGTEIDIITGEEVVVDVCLETFAEGTYVLNGNMLTLTYTEGDTTVNQTYLASTNTIRITLTNQQLVTSSGDNSYENITGDITYVLSNL